MENVYYSSDFDGILSRYDFLLKPVTVSQAFCFFGSIYLFFFKRGKRVEKCNFEGGEKFLLSSDYDWCFFILHLSIESFQKYVNRFSV